MFEDVCLSHWYFVKISLFVPSMRFGFVQLNDSRCQDLRYLTCDSIWRLQNLPLIIWKLKWRNHHQYYILLCFLCMISADKLLSRGHSGRDDHVFYRIAESYCSIICFLDPNLSALRQPNQICWTWSVGSRTHNTENSKTILFTHQFSYTWLIGT